ncbi:hypothetical protein B0H14DRAFT_2572653 [Mycena olivaceomarginata]|nr:hypothetical protein B0H14DRAFT_2572653 [Mycena olivaceomarginata]
MYIGIISQYSKYNGTLEHAAQWRGSGRALTICYLLISGKLIRISTVLGTRIATQTICIPWIRQWRLGSLVNLGFDSNPTRVVLVRPSGDRITNLAYEDHRIVFITLSGLATFRTLDSNPVCETFRLSEFLKIWAGKTIQKTEVQMMSGRQWLGTGAKKGTYTVFGTVHVAGAIWCWVEHQIGHINCAINVRSI